MRGLGTKALHEDVADLESFLLRFLLRSSSLSQSGLSLDGLSGLIIPVMDPIKGL